MLAYRDVFNSSFEVKAAGGGVVVSVRLELHASISKDGCVVSPGGFGQVHIVWPCMKPRLWQKKK